MPSPDVHYDDDFEADDDLEDELEEDSEDNEEEVDEDVIEEDIVEDDEEGRRTERMLRECPSNCECLLRYFKVGRMYFYSL